MLTNEELAALETDAREMADETRAKGGFNYLASTTLDLVGELRAERTQTDNLIVALHGVRAHLHELEWRGLPDVQFALARIEAALVGDAEGMRS